MANQLTTEQVLLINNLMYMSNKEPFQGITSTSRTTIGDWITDILNKVNVDGIDTSKDYGNFTTGEEWLDIVRAVNNDPQLMNMQIAGTHVDGPESGGGGGTSVLLVDPSTNEAVVAFQGTASGEWYDNFEGGGPTGAEDGVSTPCQENALEWYQSMDLRQYDTVTVTGHSKGGNKAKYVTIMDDSVDRCISFDGQGFSDEFMETYAEDIAFNQDKISNHNVESDYVNLLLNDVGKTTYYKGYNYGEDGFLENHCPNTFLKFEADGSFQMVEGTRDERMVVLDEFLNSYLRSLLPEEKQKVLNLVGEIVQGGFNGAGVEEILDTLLEGDNVDCAANLFAYLIEYQKKNPELIEIINSVMKDMGLEEYTKIVNTIADITEWWGFELFMNDMSRLTRFIPWYVYDFLAYLCEKNGIPLSEEDLRKLIGMIGTMENEMDRIKIKENGSDIQIVSISGTYKFATNFSGMRMVQEELSKCAQGLDRNAEQVRSVMEGSNSCLKKFRFVLRSIEKEIEQEMQRCRFMQQTLSKVCKCYESTEMTLI